jgi:hypothetical protein
MRAILSRDKNAARAAREILIGDANVASTLNHYARLLDEFYKR